MALALTADHTSSMYSKISLTVVSYLTVELFEYEHNSQKNQFAQTTYTYISILSYFCSFSFTGITFFDNSYHNSRVLIY